MSVPPKVVPFESWTIRGRWWPTMKRRQQSIAAVIHHSVTDTTGRTGLAQVQQIEEIIYRRRIRSRFSMVAYSFLVDTTGVIYEGRGTKFRNGANNDSLRSGFGNAVTLSFCFAGNYHPGVAGIPTLQPTPGQLKPVGDLIAWLGLAGELSRTYEIVPHRYVHTTACPGDNLANEAIDDLVRYTQFPDSGGAVHPPLYPSPTSDLGDFDMRYVQDTNGDVWLIGAGWHRDVGTAPAGATVEPVAGLVKYILPDLVAAGVSVDVTDARK